MSRRAAVIEEDFDDDTDLPLPSRPLPNTGTRGPILEAIGGHDDGDDDDDDDEGDDDSDGVPELIDTQGRAQAGPASPQGFGFSKERQRMPGVDDNANLVTDITPYKK